MLPVGRARQGRQVQLLRLLPRVVSYFTIDDQMYAMPFNTSGPVLYYNKKAFGAAGLDPEKPPATLAEVRSMPEIVEAASV